MPSCRAKYRVCFYCENDNGVRQLVIRDVGPWDQHRTVTNDAEAVVADLFAAGRLVDGMRLLYYDSDGVLGEILIEDRKFAGFAVPVRIKQVECPPSIY